ncbi:MAG: hypothetical protein KBT11_05040 [Treponema sp.]|nr:hypothetical protein [Candidatus Treponema equifaecale]
MKKLTVPVLNLLLAAGFVCILAGLLLISYFSASFRQQIPVSAIITMVSGAAIVYIAIALLRWASIFFAGLYIFACGLLFTFIHANVVESNLSQLWPLFVIFCGLCLLLTCLFKHRRIRSVYGMPAGIMIGMGIVFFLFSFKIITISFVSFISKWFPLILICFGAVLVGIFVYQKAFSGYFPYDKDELADITDERDILSGDAKE